MTVSSFHPNYCRIYIGYDPRHAVAFRVSLQSIYKQLKIPIRVHWLELTGLQAKGLYTRPTKRVDGKLFDVISAHPMSTEFAISRFLVPHIAQKGWALFVDGDVMARTDLAHLFELADPKYALMCVKHNFIPSNETKMEGQVQSAYSRKNWSSVCLWNCDHPSVKEHMTPDYVNTATGRDLHNFVKFNDEEIGALPETYNYLVGHSTAPNPKLVHFTDGTPNLPDYQDCEFAQEWRDWLERV